MTQGEFQNQVARLKDVYGPKAYPDERVRLMWVEVSSLDGKWFEEAVSSLIASARYAPLAQEFSNYIGAERERSWKASNVVKMFNREATYSCAECKDIGVFLCVTGDLSQGKFAFRCRCPKGMADMRRNIPQYKAEHLTQGYVVYDVG